MAIAYDTSAKTSYAKTSSPFTWSHNVAAGDNRLLVVVIAAYHYGSPSPDCTGVTHDGVAMTKVRSDAKNSGDLYCQTSIWFLHNPATGSKTISATVADFYYASGASASYTGAAQVSTADAVNGLTGLTSSTDKSATVTTVEDNCWGVAVGFALGYMTPATISALQTQRQTQEVISGSSTFMFSDLNGVKTPAGGQSMGFHIHSDTCYAISVASFAPVAVNMYSGRGVGRGIGRGIFR